MSTTTTYTGVRIVDMPDLGAVTDDSSVVGEHAGSGRFAATAFRTYVAGLGTTNTGRNLLHNPMFNISQRTGPWTTSGYTADRWDMGLSGGTLSVSIQNIADNVRDQIGDEAAAQGLQWVCVGGGGATDLAFIEQRVEGLRRTAGKTVTLSFWAAAASGTPSLGCGLTQVFGTGGSPSGPVVVVGRAVTLSTVWTRYSVAIAVPSVAGYTFGTAGTDCLLVRLCMSAGVTAGSQFGSPGVQAWTGAIWGVQLEIGPATALEKPDPRFDLANCLRFAQSITISARGYATGAGQHFGHTVLFTQMRATPTAVPLSGGTNTNCSVAPFNVINANSAVYDIASAATGDFSALGVVYFLTADL